MRTVKFMFEGGPMDGKHPIYRTMHSVPRKGEMVSIPIGSGGTEEPLAHYRVHDVQHDMLRNEVVLWLSAIGGNPPYR